MRVAFVALTYILEPGSLGEQKSKAAQLGIKRIMEMGIMPQHHRLPGEQPGERKSAARKFRCIRTCRCGESFSMHDVDSIYLIPDAPSTTPAWIAKC